MIDESRTGSFETAYVALGSNIQPRRKYIERAVNEIHAHPGVEVVTVSSIYETAPVGGPEGQGPFLNAVAEVKTFLEPMDLLDALQAVERQLGRKRDVPWGPRTIDLDVLLYGRRIVSEQRLIIPHPLMHERRFVMQGLAEIAPDVEHPMIGMSARTILESLGEDV